MRVTAGQRWSQGRIKPPTAQSGAKLKGLSAGQQAPTRSSHPLHSSVKHNPDQNGLVQSIPRKGADVSQSDADKAAAAQERSRETESFFRTVKTATRRKYTPEERVRIVLEGFRREVTVSDLCRRKGIRPHSPQSQATTKIPAAKPNSAPCSRPHVNKGGCMETAPSASRPIPSMVSAASYSQIPFEQNCEQVGGVATSSAFLDNL